MYNITVTGVQTLVGTIVSVSVCDTDDLGEVHHLFGWRTFTADGFEGLAGGSLEEFLEQTVTALVNGLSTGSPML